MTTKKILILEDDLKTLSFLLNKLSILEDQNYGKYDIAVTVLSEYTRVEKYINKLPENEFDVILLDRDCKLCGSFHVLDKKFNVERIISISSTPQWNELAKQRGITKIIHKDFGNLSYFAKEVTKSVEQLLTEKKI